MSRNGSHGRQWDSPRAWRAGSAKVVAPSRRALCLTGCGLIGAILLGACGSTGQFPDQTPATKTSQIAAASSAAPSGISERSGISKKGSLLFFPHVEVKWDAAGTIKRDTFLTLTNDYAADVQVQLYLVNGDAPLDAVFAGNPPVLVERSHTGWNWVDVQMPLTGDESTYWSALSGQPKGIVPLTILDPGVPAGRPDTDPTNPGGRVLRGFVFAWAVQASGQEIVWNHLTGSATVVDYADGSAAEYAPWAFQAHGVNQGNQPASCLTLNLDNGQCLEQEVVAGALDLDGFEYDALPDRLQFKFHAAGSTFGQPGPSLPQTTIDGRLTLAIVDADLRQDTTGPVTTKAKFDIWNANEVRFSGTEKCVTCWDSQLLAAYTDNGVPNHFTVTNLHTSVGKARVDGVRSDRCPQSSDASILGVMFKEIRFPYQNEQTIQFMKDVTALELGGQGHQSARIVYDIIEPPAEAHGGEGS